MDVAFSHQLNDVITAYDFHRLPAKQRAGLRSRLSCVACKQPAIFRGPSRNGRGRCFVGHPHAEGCELATVGDGAHGVGGQERVPRRLNPGNHLVIDFRHSADGDPDAPGTARDRARRARGRRFDGSGNGPQRSQSYRRLRKLLQNLLHDVNFADAPMVIELPGELTLPARQFFRRLKDARGSDDALLGYWGRIKNAVNRGGTIWLNTERPAIPVHATEKAALLNLAKVEKLSELDDAHVLVLGRVHSSQNGRLFINFKDDLSRMAIVRAKPVKSGGDP